MANIKKPIHTVPGENGGWANKREGVKTPISSAGTKAEALAIGREQAKKDGTEHVIHNKNGQISQKNSYGNDKFPPRG